MLVGFISTYSVGDLPDEERAAYEWLKTSGMSHRFVRFEDLNGTTSKLDECNTVWWHTTERVQNWPIASSAEVIMTIQSYCERGGALFLTLLAAEYTHYLGIETIPPDRIVCGFWEGKTIMEGYPDLRGFHSFLNHSLFDGLQGGVYVWMPEKGEPYCEAVYSKKKNPDKGTVLAIERARVGFSDERKCIINHIVGKGKILSIGAHLYFNPKIQEFHHHRDLFLGNVFEELSHPPKKTSYCFFPKVSAQSETVHHMKPRKREIDTLEEKIGIVDSQPEGVKSSALTLTRENATDDFFDVTGERVFVMGEERKGVGEVWVPPIRLLRYLKWGVVQKGVIQWSDSGDVKFSSKPECVTRESNGDGWKIKETVLCRRKDPAAMVTLDYAGDGLTHLVIKAAINFRLMWPYPDDTVTVDRGKWNSKLQAFEFQDERRLFSTIVGSSEICYEKVLVWEQDITWEDGQFSVLNDGESSNEFTTGMVFDLSGKKDISINLVIAGMEGSIKEVQQVYQSSISDPLIYLKESREYYDRFFASCVAIDSPDQEFNDGYRWALVGTDRHFLHTPGLGRGFVAGFSETVPGWGSARPGYAWYFGRDSVWTCFAVLAYGDFEKVRDQLKLFGDYQDISGKIFHELSLSGVVHHDSADSTPLYIVLMGEYLSTSGDVKFIHSQWHRLEKAMIFLRKTIKNDNGFIENSNVGHGWVEFGPLAGSYVEIYLASCWAEALRQFAFIARTLGNEDVSNICEVESKTIMENIDKEFWNAETQFYDAGICIDSNNKTEISILPAIPILFGHLPFEKSQSVAQKFINDDFSAPWGVRIMSRKNPGYHGSRYHTGTVWPLFTGWVSLAEYETHLPEAAFQHIIANYQDYQRRSLGWVDEALHGETGEPAGVCRHQAWSEAMVCLPIIRGMLGLKVNAIKNLVTMCPHVPKEWNRLDVSNIRIGQHTLNFKFKKTPSVEQYRFKWSGSKPLTLELQPPTLNEIDKVKLTVDGEKRDFYVKQFGNCTHLQIPLELKDEIVRVSLNYLV